MKFKKFLKVTYVVYCTSNGIQVWQQAKNQNSNSDRMQSLDDKYLKNVLKVFELSAISLQCLLQFFA